MENLTDLANFLRGLHEKQTISIHNNESYNSKIKRVFNSNEELTIGFDMNRTEVDADLSDHPCGSACCIGGWVGLLRPDLAKSNDLAERIMNLDSSVSYEEAYELCFPSGTDVFPDTDDPHFGYNATPLQAAFAVEILRDTGECDWKQAMELGRDK